MAKSMNRMSVQIDPGLHDVVLIRAQLDRFAEVLASVLSTGSKFLFYAQDLVVLRQPLGPAWSTGFNLEEDEVRIIIPTQYTLVHTA
jgi:hypothetical protein